MIGGSPQHEELYERTEALGSLRTTVVKGYNFILITQHSKFPVYASCIMLFMLTGIALGYRYLNNSSLLAWAHNQNMSFAG